jgi:Cu(I)/Ag(I) efflux system membrane fusion protein
MKMQASTMDTLHQKENKVMYTCPMHPQIREDAPGKCPICGMTLVPVENNEMSGTKKGADTAVKLKIPQEQQFLANIHTDTARLEPLANQVVLTGTTLFDPQRQVVISAWVGGWIEKMYIRNPGEMISAGQKLYDLYSPDLLAAEKDYVLTFQQKDLFKSASVDFTATLQAMRQKLLRWGLSLAQIGQLLKEPLTGKITIFSKASGYLTQKIKEEGDYVKEGDVVMNIAQNNTLWVQAELYDNELPLLVENPQIWVELDVSPGKRIPGKIAFNNPTLENNSRVHLVNIAIPNIGGKIQPGMLAYVYLQTGGGQSNVVIPKSAVIYDANRNYVWIQGPDSSFEMRGVRLGSNNRTMIAVLQGIQPGDRVVSQGAYLVNSEYILKYGTGVNMAGMQMSDMKMSGRSK